MNGTENKARTAKMNDVVWKLVRRNVSAGQLAGYALANFVGLAIILTAVKFYRDVTVAWYGDDSAVDRDCVIISKKVTGLGSLLGGEVSFSEDEIADIAAQPWARRVGRFTASAFNVYASVDMGGRSMSTYLFFESVPDDFMDINPADWTFDPGHPEVPVVMSKDYLTLYNFGFAASRGLPQLSESMIGMVPVTVSLSGNGRQMSLPARIVGFSPRLNTIAVPERFMEWANSRFAGSPTEAPSRLIIELASPGDPAVSDYLAAHGYESAGDKVDNGRAAYFLSVVTGVVVAVGAIISVLALFILMLSISLLLQKNREKLHDLMLLGYSPRRVAWYYHAIVVTVNAVVLVASIAVMLAGSHCWSQPLASLGIAVSSPWIPIAVGITVMAAVTGINIIAINRNISRNF